MAGSYLQELERLDTEAREARCQCGHTAGAHRDRTKGCLGGTGFCICPRFVEVARGR
jgi:hypothetical protein